MSITFTEWQKEHPDFIKNYVVSDADPKKPVAGAKWGRLICKWNEKTEGHGKIAHVYAATINLKNGDIYLDCSKKRIYAKLAAYLIINTLALIAKTISHIIFPVGIGLAISKAMKQAKKAGQELSGKELAKTVFTVIGKNFLDIIKTPLYAIALIVLTIGGLIVGPLAPTLLYDIREAISRVERSLLWMSSTAEVWENKDWSTRFPCLHPADTAMDITTTNVWKSGAYGIEHLEITGADWLVTRRMANWASRNVEFARDNCTEFNGFKRLPANQSYVSPVLEGRDLS